MIHPAALSEDELEQECKLTFRRASGPGGQNRNKVETAVHVTHLPTGLSGQASERRTQGENRQVAIHRLRLALAINVRSDACETGQAKVRQYISRGKLAISDTNTDWPAVLAELLNLIATHQWQLSPVGESLQTSSSQIVKALAREPAALAYLNSKRVSLGLTSLKT
ncbi:MAG: peptide chain release factor-like protein [Pirellula sp.]|nr:peptide chain release factor-like protein [Pirellula sp.]